MECRKSISKISNFQDKFYGNRNNKKEGRRERRPKIRWSESSHSEQEASRSRNKGLISRAVDVKPKAIQDEVKGLVESMKEILGALEKEAHQVRLKAKAVIQTEV